MNHRSRALLALILAASSVSRAAEIAGGPAAGARPVAAIGALSAPLSAPADLGARLETALTGVSLRGFKELAPAITGLSAAYAKQGAPEQRLILAALGQPGAAVEQSLAAAGVPAAAAKRVAAVVAKAQGAAAKDPALRAALGAAAQAAAAPPVSGDSSPEMTKVRALVDSVVSGWSVAAAPAAPIPSAPIAAQPAAPSAPAAPAVPAGKLSDSDLLNPAKRPQVQYGAESLPIIALPSEGTDIAQLWLKAHGQAAGATIVAYNFDDMDMAKSIVERAKAGEPITFIGDYSNWFPERLSQTNHGGQATPQTEAMKFVIANLPAMGTNFQFFILKGIGSIGINHNKFTVFRGPHGKLLQGGSFNYTKTSQLNHWEVVVFTQEADRIDAFERYAAWLQRRARPYSPDLMPEDPKFDPADPIPTMPPSEEVALHGVPFPKVMFSPNGEGEAQLTKAIALVKEKLGILMFSPFPTPDMVAAIEALILKKIAADMIADAGQLANATPVVGLVDHGMPVKEIHGPDMELHHEPYNAHSKEHEKDMLFDADLPDGIVKMADSLNISKNAFNHNFENIQLWSGYYAQFLAAHYRYLWNLAHELKPDLIAKLREKIAGEKSGKVAATGPWQGEPAAPAAAGK